jgi:hypothetical protein
MPHALSPVPFILVTVFVSYHTLACLQEQIAAVDTCYACWSLAYCSAAVGAICYPWCYR